MLIVPLKDNEWYDREKKNIYKKAQKIICWHQAFFLIYSLKISVLGKEESDIFHTIQKLLLIQADEVVTFILFFLCLQRQNSQKQIAGDRGPSNSGYHVTAVGCRRE